MNWCQWFRKFVHEATVQSHTLFCLWTKSCKNVVMASASSSLMPSELQISDNILISRNVCLASWSLQLPQLNVKYIIRLSQYHKLLLIASQGLLYSWKTWPWRTQGDVEIMLGWVYSCKQYKSDLICFDAHEKGQQLLRQAKSFSARSADIEISRREVSELWHLFSEARVFLNPDRFWRLFLMKQLAYTQQLLLHFVKDDASIIG